MLIIKKEEKKRLKEDSFEEMDRNDFQNVKGANLMIDPLTY
jgi:hypothetical protein